MAIARILLVSAVLGLVASTGAGAATFWVSTPSELQAALTAAQDNGEDDVILLAAGVYAVSQVLTYQAASDAEGSLTLRGEGAGSTVLDAGGAGPILVIESPTPADVTVEGIGFTGGRLAASAWPLEAAGLSVWSWGTVTIEGCAFTRNTATEYSSGAGGLYLYARHARIVGASFRGNAGDSGYGSARIYRPETVVVESSAFEANRGPALRIVTTKTGSEIRVRNSVFSANRSDAFAGGCAAVDVRMDDGVLALEGNRVTGNTSDSGFGAGVCVKVDESATIAFKSNVVTNNVAPLSSDGAGVYVHVDMDGGDTRIEMRNNVISGNDAGGGRGQDLYVLLDEDDPPHETRMVLEANVLADGADPYLAENGPVYVDRDIEYVARGNATGRPEDNAFFVPAPTEPVDVPGDLNGDRVVDRADYAVFRSSLGRCAGSPGFIAGADYDGDGCVTYADYRQWYLLYRRYVYGDEDRDGVADGADRCPGTPKVLPADATGCPAGASDGVILAGDPDRLLADAAFDLNINPGVAPEDRARDAHGREVALNELEIAFQEDATLGAVNALLRSVGGRIVNMLRGVPILVVRIPRLSGADDLDTLVGCLEDHPLVRTVRRGFFPDLAVVPGNLGNIAEASAELRRKIDHLMAIRAPAAWNVGDLLSTQPTQPTLLVADAFGLRSPLTDISAIGPDPAQFNDNPLGLWNPHGYAVLGAALAEYGGTATERGWVDGLYATYLPLEVVDVGQLRLVPDPANANRLVPRVVETGTLASLEFQILARVRALVTSGNSRIVLNTSLQFDCSNAQTAAANCTPQNAAKNAKLWIEKVRRAGLEDRFVHVTAAGNIVFPGASGDAVKAEYASSFAAAALLEGLTDDHGAPIPPLSNVLVVESVINAPWSPHEPVCLDSTSKRGGTVSAVGHDVWTFTGPTAGAGSLTGTSMAAPQVAALAATLWTFAPDLTTTQVIDIIRSTARPVRVNASADPECTGDPPAPAVDAYAALLALDREGRATVRLGLLDVSDAQGNPGRDDRFDENDVALFLAAFGREGIMDFSRFDLNGDGRTGGNFRAPFDLDANGRADGRVLKSIGGITYQFDEGSVSDLEALCYYAYSHTYYRGDTAVRSDLLQDRCTQVLEADLPACVTTDYSYTERTEASFMREDGDSTTAVVTKTYDYRLNYDPNNPAATTATVTGEVTVTVDGPNNWDGPTNLPFSYEVPGWGTQYLRWPYSVHPGFWLRAGDIAAGARYSSVNGYGVGMYCPLYEGCWQPPGMSKQGRPLVVRAGWAMPYWDYNLSLVSREGPIRVACAEAGGQVIVETWEYGPEPFWWLRAGRYGRYQLDSPDWPCQGGDPTACEPPDLTVHIRRTVTRVFGGHLLLE